jgi:sialate O-acetylesterase
MRTFTLISLFALSHATFAADLEVASVFSDHMIVQEGLPIQVWGWSAGDDQIQVSWDGAILARTVSKNGEWRVALPAQAYGENPFDAHSITIASGLESIELNDVLVGEVWLASGQSNMSWPLRETNAFEETSARAATVGETSETRATPLPPIRGLRVFTVSRTSVPLPARDVVGDWRLFTVANCSDFTAVGTYFGLDLLAALDKPIGILHSSWGGSRVEAWMSPGALMEHAEGRSQLQLDVSSFPDRHKPAHLSNGMLSPLEGLSLAGCIWYQGESNAREPQAYGRLFPSMIDDWRRRFGDGNLPFYFVQLANFLPGEGSDWPGLREAQRNTLSAVANSGMAVTIDVGNPHDIHPRNKKAVGARLARLALSGTYQKDVVANAPLPVRALHSDKNVCTVLFEDLGTTLTPSDPIAPLEGFELAGKDGVFHPATAAATGGVVLVVWVGEGAPMQVRYCWQDDPSGLNILRADGLPVSPFRLSVEAPSKTK